MKSDRLVYDPLTPGALDDFHALVQDEHVRRYLMDGELFPREWSADRIRDSVDLFRRRGVGLWLARAAHSGERIGFCGFLEIPAMNPEPQLVYAMFERFTGKGYASEMARASIEEARRHAGFERIYAGVDEVNRRSVRVLEKLGFRVAGTRDGRFGNVLEMILWPSRP